MDSPIDFVQVSGNDGRPIEFFHHLLQIHLVIHTQALQLVVVDEGPKLRDYRFWVVLAIVVGVI